MLKLRGTGVNINKLESGHLPAQQIIDVERGATGKVTTKAR